MNALGIMLKGTRAAVLLDEEVKASLSINSIQWCFYWLLKPLCLLDLIHYHR